MGLFSVSPRRPLALSLCYRKYSWRVVFTALESFEQQQAEAGEEPSYFFLDQLCLDQVQ